MDKDYSVSLIERLSQAPGPSGFEDPVRDIIRKEMEGLGCAIDEDGIGNLVCTFRGQPDGKTILFASHMDEVGFMVSDILENGYLRLINLGGWSTLTLPSSPVEVISSKGDRHYGVIGQISPHFIKKGTPLTVPELSELFVDIGSSSAEEVKDVFGIRIGDIAVPVAPFKYVPETDRVFSKAFDDRIGCAVLIETARQLKGSRNTCIFAFTTQEEVGERGSSVLKNYIHPDYSVIVEGAPADDMPSGPAHPLTCQGKGAHIRLFDPTHIASREIVDSLRMLAERDGIMIQEAIRTGGGTDAVTMSRAGRGSKTIVTGVATRYAHSHVSSVSLFDYYELIRLISGFAAL
ncbi:MAG: M42 family metallopeptidase [Bullifex sp.]